jgi:transposase
MTPESDPSAKVQALKAAGAFNPRADKVRHPLFGQSEFFDPQDMPQLKYEALRALEADDYSVARAAGEFGLSRPTLYQAQDQLKQQGLEGLLPRKRGPRKPHKLTPEVRQHLQELTVSEPQLNAQELARRLRQKFKVKIHPRTIEKALQPRAKKGALPLKP